jgi:hypothetical protein
MFFPIVNAPKVMLGALSWRRQIAVNQRRMMQNAVREIVGNLLRTLCFQRPAAIDAAGGKAREI